MGQVNGSKQSATRLAPPTPDPVCFFDSQQQFTTRRYNVATSLQKQNTCKNCWSSREYLIVDKKNTNQQIIYYQYLK